MFDFEGTRLMSGCRELWRSATRSELLGAIADGSVQPETLDRWLAEERHFAGALARATALAAARAPRAAQRLLVRGLVSLDEEIEWFAVQERGRGLSTKTHPVHAAGRRYADFLLATAYGKPISTVLAVLHGIEAAYCTAWSRLDAASGPHAAAIWRWSSEERIAYARDLGDAADGHESPEQHVELETVLRLGCDFWNLNGENGDE